MERCKTRRHTWYWTHRGELEGKAKQLSELREATTIGIDGADSIFSDLASKAVSLDQLAKPHPLSARTAVATVKKYLPESRHRIQLHDFVKEEVGKVTQELVQHEFDYRTPITGDAFKSRLHVYEGMTMTEVLLGIVGDVPIAVENGRQRLVVEHT